MKKIFLFLPLLILSNISLASGFLHVSGSRIVDENGNPWFGIGPNVRGLTRNPNEQAQYIFNRTFDDCFTLAVRDANNISNVYGMNAIRLVCFYWEEFERSTSDTDYVYNQTMLDMLEYAVNAYTSQGVYVMINFHHREDSPLVYSMMNSYAPMISTTNTEFSCPFYSNTSLNAARDHLKNAWLNISARFKNNPGVLGYDLLNEPHGGCSNYRDTHELWYKMAEYVIQALRANGDNHIIFIDESPWASDMELMNRTINDNNVVYQPHPYQGTDFRPEWLCYLTSNCNGHFSCNASQYNFDYLNATFWCKNDPCDRTNCMASKARQFNIPIWIGEYGLAYYGDSYQGDQYATTYINDIHSLFDSELGNYITGVSYWAYQYKSFDPQDDSYPWFATLLQQYAIGKPVTKYNQSMAKVSISGQLKDKNNNALNANITALQPGTDTVINSTQTNQGNYNLLIQPLTYDIKYDILNFFIPNFFIKLLSLNVVSSLSNVVNYVTNTSNQNIYFTVDVNANQLIQTYSPQRPTRILANGTPMSNVSSYSQLANNTWFYNQTENKLYMIPPISCSCSNWANQGCNLAGCTNQMYQTRTCSPSGCDITSQCVYNASCIPTCPNGVCSVGENCPADASSCSEPAVCYCRTCVNGCNNPASPITTGQQDAEGSNRCDDTVGCGSPPCQCDGSGNCISRQGGYIFQDDFESGNFNVWTGTSGTPAVVSTQKYNGAYSSENNASGNFIYKDFTGQSTVFVRGYFRFSQLPTTSGDVRFLRLGYGGGAWGTLITRLSLRYTGSYGLTLTLETAYPSSIYNYDINMNTDAWYPFEIKFVKHATNGEYRVWFNGNEVITATSLDTSGSDDATKIALGNEYSSTVAPTVWIDDVTISKSYIGS